MPGISFGSQLMASVPGLLEAVASLNLNPGATQLLVVKSLPRDTSALGSPLFISRQQKLFEHGAGKSPNGSSASSVVPLEHQASKPPSLGNQALSAGLSLAGSMISDLLASNVFDLSSEGGLIASLLTSSAFSSMTNTMSDNLLKGASLTQGLGKNVGSSVAGAAAGIAGNYIGKGITDLGGNSKLSRGIGAGVGSAVSRVGGTVLSNVVKGESALKGIINTGKAAKTATSAAKGAGAAAKGIGAASKAANLTSIGGIAASVIGTGLEAAFGASKEYGGKYGSITQTMDTIYDVASGVVGMFGPVGMAVSGAMALNKGLSNMFGSTDGMCVCAGTKVITTNGEIKNVEDLVLEDGIIGWNEKTHEIRPNTIKGIVEPRLKECLELKLQSGKYLNCSTDHPIYTKVNSKWKFIPAEQLKEGDIIATTSLETPKEIIEDVIISSKSIGVLTVYNLEAAEDHTYIANGIITHNTKTDAILGSAFMPAPVKWVNVWGAKTTDKFNNLSWLNTEKADQFMGDSFGNLKDVFNKAREEGGKTYGTFSRKAYKRALANVLLANRTYGKVLAMADLNELLNIRSQDMSTINALRYAQDILGGWSPLARGKYGMKILNNATNHNMGMRLLSAAALIDNKQVILSRCREIG